MIEAESVSEVPSRAVIVGGRRSRRRAESLPGEARRIGYLYVAPAFLLYAAFNLVPLLQGANDSLYNWDGITPGTWVGLGNYADFFTDPAIRAGYVHVLVLMFFYSFMLIALNRQMLPPAIRIGPLRIATLVWSTLMFGSLAALTIYTQIQTLRR